MRNQNKLAVLFFFSVLAANVAYSQENKDSIEWKMVSQDLIVSINKLQNKSIQFRETAKKVKEKIFCFIGSVETAKIIPTKEVLVIVYNDLRVIKSLISDNIVTKDSINLCFNYLDSSYQSRNHLDSFYTFNPSVIQNIKVRILVTKDEKYLQGYDIECRTKLWMDKKALWHSDRPRSPIDIELPPGKYIFSVLKAEKEIKRVEREIGLRNEKTAQLIEITL